MDAQLITNRLDEIINIYINERNATSENHSAFDHLGGKISAYQEILNWLELNGYTPEVEGGK